jgi:hypothetical protein
MDGDEDGAGRGDGAEDRPGERSADPPHGAA